ncbi:hypothetical protein [Phenylobacterium sp. SCN 70-31]|uniref:hypothetical protein n=1 Tax=Phenylobacterium sp. SCN 70-31 TaxID=1660129 RepID=UPI00086DA47A|nr:hypothetical protein [Phenylobacterium sp. SCN 70-31]ODT89949.1 MAG: hypothetical protein ABS78_01075 [Phenylobacterium sp. SCN 70-31]
MAERPSSAFARLGRILATWRARIDASADLAFLDGLDAVIGPLCAALPPGARIAVVGARTGREEALYAARLAARGFRAACLTAEEFAQVSALRRALTTRRPTPAVAADTAALATAFQPPRADALLVICPWISRAFRSRPVPVRVLDAAPGIEGLHAAWAMAPI